MEEDEFEELNTSMLWDRIFKGAPDDQIYMYLKAILTKVTSHKETREQVFTTKGINSILKLLSQKYHSPLIHILAIALMGVLGNIEELHRYVVNKGVVCHVTTLLNKELEPEVQDNLTGPHAKLQIELYKTICSIIFYFSTGPMPTKDACLFEGIVPRLLNLLTSTETPKSGLLYGYDKEGTDIFSELVHDKHLVAKLHSMQGSDWANEFWHEHLKRSTCDIKNILKLNKSHCEVYTLLDTSGEVDVNIPLELVNKNTAWSRDCLDSQSDELEDEKLRLDIRICHVVNPEYFFAHTGEEAWITVSEIRDSINSIPESRRKYLKHPPKSGVFIGAVHELYGSYVGVVIDSSEATSLVYGLDFGFITEIGHREMFLITNDLQIPRKPPQATLCRFKGIRPKFLHTSVAVLALKSLSNLSCMEAAASHFFTSNAVNQLYTLSQSSDIDIVDQVYRILSNLCKYEFVREDLCEKPMVQSIMDNLKRCYTCTTNQHLVMSGLGLLNNLLYHVDLAKAQLVEFKGVDLLIKLSRSPTIQSVKTFALKALRSFIGTRTLYQSPQRKQNAADSKEQKDNTVVVVASPTGPNTKTKSQNAPVQKETPAVSYSTSEIIRDSTSRTRNRSDSEKLNVLSAGSKEGRNRNRSSETERLSRHKQSDEPHVRSRSRSIGKPRTDDKVEIFVKARLQQDSNSSDNNTEEGIVTKRDSSGHNTTEEEEDISGSNTEGETVIATNSKEPNVMNTSTLYRQKTWKEFYVQDSVVEFVADETTEIRTVHNMARVSSTSITKIAIGFLNSGKEGRIFFGINKELQVKGSRINREERDEFRQGIDRIFKDKIMPRCMHDQYDIKFIPVVRCLDHPDLTSRIQVPDLYVIEILIKRTPKRTLYANKDDEIYFRNGADTVLACSMDIQTRVTEDLEVEYLQEIEELNTEINRLQKSY